MEPGKLTLLRQRTPFVAVFLAVFQVMLASFASPLLISSKFSLAFPPSFYPMDSTPGPAWLCHILPVPQCAADSIPLVPRDPCRLCY